MICFTPGSRVRGNVPASAVMTDVVHRSHQGRGDIGVLCVTLGSRVRGNDVGLLGNDGGGWGSAF